MHGLQAEADLAERARAGGRDDEVERARAAAMALLGPPAHGDSVRGYRFEDPVGEPAPPEALALWAQGEADCARGERRAGG